MGVNERRGRTRTTTDGTEGHGGKEKAEDEPQRTQRTRREEERCTTEDAEEHGGGRRKQREVEGSKLWQC